MKPLTLAAPVVAGIALGATAFILTLAGSGSALAAADRSGDHKLEATIVSVDRSSGTLQLSNGLVINRANLLQSASLQRLYETEGADQLQRKLPSSSVRYVARR